MKRFLCLTAFILSLVFTASSQVTTPRFGTTSSKDNTGRVITYGYSSVTFASVLYQQPKYFDNTYKIGTLTAALTDSISVTNAHVCDRVTYIFTADTLTAGRVVTFGNHFVSAGTLTVDASQKATITFVFDGVAWVETSRAKQ